MLTIEDAKQWAVENAVMLHEGRISCKNESVRMFNSIMPDLSKLLWDSGCWLAHVLESHGATAEQIVDIQGAQGQRAFCGDAWQAAVDYANEFAETGDTEEKWGPELAEKRHKELFGCHAEGEEPTDQ